MRRLYLIPVRDACNSNCSFCYMKAKKQDISKPQFIDPNKLEHIVDEIIADIKEVEITGGGEPLLHPNISDIINIFIKRGIYTKLYTNGFLLKDTPKIDEVNISRVHWDSDINKRFYRSHNQNELNQVLDHYTKLSGKIRMQTILLKGAIDSEDKALEFIKKHEDKVTTFMFRTLFRSCPLEQQNSVRYFSINHPKAKLDFTLDSYDRKLYFLNTDCQLLDYFDYGNK